MSLHFITSALSLSSYNKDEDSIVVIGRVQSLQDDQKVEMLLVSFNSFGRKRTGLVAFQNCWYTHGTVFTIQGSQGSHFGTNKDSIILPPTVREFPLVSTQTGSKSLLG